MTDFQKIAHKACDLCGVTPGSDMRPYAVQVALTAIKLMQGNGWSFDIKAAPLGRIVTSDRIYGKKTHKHSEFVPDVLWIAAKCGKVLRSYWIPEAGKNPGRWSGLATGEQPIAWQPYVVPAHPTQESPRKAAEAVSERTATQVEAKAEAEAGVSGQPEMIPALTGQFPGVNVDGPKRVGVTGGESAATHLPKPANETMGGTGDDCSFGNRGVWPPQDGASSSRGNDSLSVVTAGETATHFILEDCGSGA